MIAPGLAEAAAPGAAPGDFEVEAVVNHLQKGKRAVGEGGPDSDPRGPAGRRTEFLPPGKSARSFHRFGSRQKRKKETCTSFQEGKPLEEFLPGLPAFPGGNDFAADFPGSPLPRLRKSSKKSVSGSGFRAQASTAGKVFAHAEARQGIPAKSRMFKTPV